MVIQFGFLTIFVAAFPLAPFLALINNVMEIRVDAMKLIVDYRRPPPTRAKDIGIWFTILDKVAIFSVLTNAVIIAFTSDFIPRLVYLYKKGENATLDGYVNFSLSVFKTSDMDDYRFWKKDEIAEYDTCRYRDFRNPPTDPNKYEYKKVYWEILAIKFAFVVVFENVVLLTKSCVAWIIPDNPKKLKEQMKREQTITQSLILQHEKNYQKMEHPKNICGVAKFFKQKSAVARLRVEQKNIESQRMRLRQEEEMMRQRRQREEEIMRETTAYWRKISLPARLEKPAEKMIPRKRIEFQPPTCQASEEWRSRFPRWHAVNKDRKQAVTPPDDAPAVARQSVMDSRPPEAAFPRDVDAYQFVDEEKPASFID